jgi:hypothetical protein
MPALGASFAVLTALILASEAAHLRSAQDIVSREVTTRGTLRFRDGRISGFRHYYFDDAALLEQLLPPG